MALSTPTTEENQRDDYQRLALDHVIATEKLCALLQIPAGARVLDIGTGTGHAAIAAARRRAQVTGIDLNEDSLARARARAEAEGVDNVEFHKADAAALPFPDASFDFVLSSWAMVFLPDQAAAARELARVVRPGGVVGLTAYTRGSIASQLYDFINHVLLNRPKGPAHYDWSDGVRAGELLYPYFDAVRVTYDSHDLCFRSAVEAFEHGMRWNPNARRIFLTLDEGQRAELREHYLAVVNRQNRATDGTFMAGMEYAVITAVRKR